MSSPSTATNSFSYNAFGARISKVDSSGTSTYARSGVSVISPVLSDGTVTFTPGISTRESSTSTWSHGDIKNSLTQTAANESTTATKQYDAFGNQTSSSGTWSGPFQYGGAFGYQSDVDSGLKLLGHRYYNSSTGRFLTRDPLKAEANDYVYAASSPTCNVDPAGGLFLPLVIAVVGALIFAGMEPAHAPSGPVTPEEHARAAEMARQAGADLALLWIAAVEFAYLGAAGLMWIARVRAARATEAVVEGGRVHMAGRIHPRTGVPFDKNGFPIFDKWAKADVRITPTGTRYGDTQAATRAAGYSRDTLPKGHLWHHHQEQGRMQLVPRGLHEGTGHNGGFSTWYPRGGVLPQR